MLWPVPPAPAPVHEQRAAAVELLDARPQLLRVADVDLIESWIRAAGTWALVDPLVDPLAGHVVMPMCCSTSASSSSATCTG